LQLRQIDERAQRLDVFIGDERVRQVEPIQPLQAFDRANVLDDAERQAQRVEHGELLNRRQIVVLAIAEEKLLDAREHRENARIDLVNLRAHEVDRADGPEIGDGDRTGVFAELAAHLVLESRVVLEVDGGWVRLAVRGQLPLHRLDRLRGRRRGCDGWHRKGAHCLGGRRRRSGLARLRLVARRSEGEKAERERLGDLHAPQLTPLPSTWVTSSGTKLYVSAAASRPEFGASCVRKASE
jgi:hypothetical protein